MLLLLPEGVVAEITSLGVVKRVSHGKQPSPHPPLGPEREIPARIRACIEDLTNLLDLTMQEASRKAS